MMHGFTNMPVIDLGTATNVIATGERKSAFSSGREPMAS